MQIRISELWEAYLSGPGVLRLSDPHAELPLPPCPRSTGTGLPTTQSQLLSGLPTHWQRSLVQLAVKGRGLT